MNWVLLGVIVIYTFASWATFRLMEVAWSHSPETQEFPALVAFSMSLFWWILMPLAFMGLIVEIGRRNR